MTVSKKKKIIIMTKKCLINYPLCLYAQAFIGAINEKMCITKVSRDWFRILELLTLRDWLMLLPPC